ncbi:hypothetical protein A4G99_15185 [Haladaptatus sp. R4]|uniref:hypothetical protein n=1 Tax=Haladaptatus sp. R4 TaxID=1679489 RepID=UPI0007B4A371|nr:hypothetical protein [Haladaptatus sp. R4]KZN23358.1 hypothetical protein A4G99_15185 [Haladaptatus sp. R4]
MLENHSGSDAVSRSVDLPDGWDETTGSVTDPRATYAYDVTDSARVVVGLVFRSSDASGDIQLRVSVVDSTALIHRHDYVVAEYDDTTTAIEKMETFVELVSSTFRDESHANERVFVTVEGIISEFQSDTSLWHSLFSGGRK